MTEFHQDLLEELIFNPDRSVLRYGINRPWREVWDALMELKAEGLVRNHLGENPHEAEDENEENWAKGPFTVHWRYCGGPISKVLAGHQTLS